MKDPSRRRILNWFLGTAVGALVASVLYPVVRFVIPPEVPESTTNEVSLPANDPALRQDGFKIVRFGQEPVIVVKVSEQEYRAFAATCTHLDCIVEYRQSERVIWCNCHDGAYDLHGINIAGPPPRPLESYQAHLVQSETQGPQIIVSKA